jgi:hypothetical protein
MRKGKAMKRRNSIISAIMVLVFGLTNINTAKAQAGIFIMDDIEELNIRVESDLPAGTFIIPDLPDHDTALDYTPIGDGLWLLGCLGGAYFLRKRKKESED